MFRERTGQMLNDVGGGIGHTVDALRGGSGAGAHAAGGVADALKGVMKASAEVVFFLPRMAAKLFNTRIGGGIAAGTMVIGGAIATGVGLSEWNKKREQRKAAYPGEQLNMANALADDMAIKQMRIQDLAQQRADAIAQIANQDTKSNHAAKVEASLQAPGTPTLSA